MFAGKIYQNIFSRNDQARFADYGYELADDNITEILDKLDEQYLTTCGDWVNFNRIEEYGLHGQSKHGDAIHTNILDMKLC